ncbi:MAG TPA: Ig-like domain-containing protein [Gemmatimonadales bacterium]|nr:Ig-like domain-containing protein [Gemmatimonadales bacterium]
MAVALAGCGGGGGSGPSEPTTLAIKSGGNQDGQVGSPLAAKVVVEARNTKGPVAGVTIAAGVETPGGGSVAPSQATTAADGTAQFTWTLGSKLGVQTLSVSTTGASPLHATTTANAAAGTATIIVATTEVNQLAVVSHPVPVLPSVRVTDNFDNPIPGTAVTFEALNGGSTLSGTSQTTNASGIATLGGWSVGPDALVYQVRARIANGAVVIFETRGIPFSFAAFAGIGQSANAGTALPVLPAVRALREDGTPMANVAVSFAVLSGGGTLSGATTVTAADGTARPGSWILGTTPGTNRIEATTLGKPAVSFDATGIAAVPAVVVASAGTALSGFFGNFLSGAPEVTVKDAGGLPVAGIGVTFAVAQGGGLLSRATAQTDFQGRARLGSWRLGAAGPQSVTATVAGVATPVTFNATASAPPAGTFHIEVRYNTSCPTCITPSTEQRAAFDAAVARWTTLLLATGAPYPIKPSEVDPSCGSISGTVDGVIITAQLDSIDGPNRILGAAGACVLRDDGFLPVTGLMHFDKADLPLLQTSGALNPVILHEMAHVLGFGTIWNFNVPGTIGFDPAFGTNLFLVGTTSDPTFNGAGAQAAFLGVLPPTSTFSGLPVPVEATGGPGTAFSHWRENGSFVNELMTGFLNSGSNPLSAVTVDQFRDLGYVVNDALAESYSFPSVIQAAGLPTVALVEGRLEGFITVINRQGKAVGRFPRTYR